MTRVQGIHEKRGLMVGVALALGLVGCSGDDAATGATESGTSEGTTTTSTGTMTTTATTTTTTTSTTGSGSESDGTTTGTMPMTTTETSTVTSEPLPECGNGVMEGDEECDDGNADNTDACLDTCVAATCGDGLVQDGVEACDDGNANNNDECTDACALAACGDGFLQGEEICDDANDDNTDACLDTCAAASCGDGFVQEGAEACDDGNDIDDDECTNACTLATCGDGIVQAGEQCDDANDVDTDACPSSCQDAVCGDGFVLMDVEACDGAGETDLCDVDCTPAECGDQTVNQTAGEQCDEGGMQTMTCEVSCLAPACGDGVLNTLAGEVCDDGNLNPGDGCDPMCKEELRDNLMRCGSASRNVADFIPQGVNLNVVAGCTPDNNTQALLVTRSGAAMLNGPQLQTYVQNGGIVLTEWNITDEVFSILFTPVVQGANNGDCWDRAPIVHQYNPGDPFWVANAFNPINTQRGCGYDVDAFPGITPIAGWNNSSVAIAYRALGQGRLWLTDFDWQDTNMASNDPLFKDTLDLMGYMITHKK